MFRIYPRTILLLAVLFSSVLAACGNVNTPATAVSPSGEGLPIRAVATTSIIADLVKNVGGERVAVSAILPSGADPHSYTPTPSDVQAVSESQILFENGLGLDEWLDELTENAGGTRATVVLTNGLTPIEAGDHDEHDDAEHAASETASEEADHEHASGDPHMWFDVQNTIRYVENIRDGLKQLDPAGTSIYDGNAASYIDQLKQLDVDIRAQVQTIPADRRKLITNHDNFGYFARRYGFEVVGSIFEGVSTEQEPSAQQIAELVRLIHQENVPAIFAENTINPRLAEQIANETGIDVVTTLFTDALGEAGSEADTYIKMMRYNVEQITAALK